MSAVQAHYDRHLGPVYTWMAGGAGPAIERGAAELAGLGVGRSHGGYAVDLGAGFGAHAVPLARLGFKVLAVDACAALLEELEGHRQALSIETVHADLGSFARYLSGTPGLVLCMGDTITHLTDEDAVTGLVETVSDTLAAGGRLVITFRDYSSALTGEQRFIPVRSDDTRILTCFLEYTASRVTVHDLLHEWDGSAWQQRVSVYQKLRISPRWLAGLLEENGFTVTQHQGTSGMVCLVARRR